MIRLLMLALLFPSISLGQVVTSITGSIEHGESIVISGSSLGIKSPAAPVLWDDFEGNVTGDPVGSPVIGSYSRVGTSKYSDVSPYAGSACTLSEVYEGAPGFPGLVSNWIPDEETDGFASMKFKLISSFGSMEPHNIKLLRLNTADPDETHGYPNYNIGGDRGYTTFYGIVNHGLSGQVYAGGFTAIPNLEDWNSLSISARCGGVDTANGFVERVLNGGISKTENIVTLQDGDFSGYRSAYFCGYISGEGYTVQIYLDDVYADISLARVEIGNSATLASCTHTEIQIPSAWATDEVTVTVNTGSFSTNDSAYLFVIDSDGIASAGYPVTIGESGSTALQGCGTITATKAE